MKRLFRIELQRGLINDRLLLSFAVALVFITYQIYSLSAMSMRWVGVPSAYAYLIEFEPEGTVFYAFVIVLPLIAAFVGSQFYVEDRHKGLFPMMITRIERKEYFWTTGFTSFIVGGIAVVIPLTIQALVAFCLFPARNDPYNWQFVSMYSNYSSLWMRFPFGLWLLSTVQIFLFGGAYALLGYAVSLYSRSRFVETIVPFSLMFGIWIVEDFLKIGFISPPFYLHIIYDDVVTYGDPRLIKWLTWITFVGISIILIRRKVSDEIL